MSGALWRRTLPVVLLASCGVVGCGRSTPPSAPGAQSAKAGAMARVAASEPSKLTASAKWICALWRGHLACVEPPSPRAPQRRDDELTLSTVPGAWRDVAVSRSHLCAARDDGHVLCRGGNQYGELGAGIAKESSEDLVEVVGVRRAVRVAVGESTSCALSDDGAVMCWGNAANGATQAKDSYIPELRALVEPSRVPLARPMKGIAIGSSVCAYDERGAFCWGGGARVHDVKAPAGITAISASLAGDVYVTTQAATYALPVPHQPWRRLLEGEEVAEAPTREVLALAGATGVTSNGKVVCGTTPAGALRCDGDRRSTDDDPRHGPIAQTWEKIERIEAFALLERSSWALTPSGDLLVNGVVFSDYTYSDTWKLGNVATAAP